MSTKKKVCVIGGAGYVGSRLVPRLIQEGYDVTVVDLGWFGIHLDPSVRLVHSDVLKLEDSFFKGYDAVLFLGGLASDPMAEFTPAFNFVSNVAAPLYAAFASRRAGVPRFIFAESCSVYGFTGGKECKEDDALSMLPYPYGVSKAQATNGLLYLVQPEFSVICLRKGTVSGWSPRMRFDLLVNAMYKSALVDGKITVNNPAISRPLLALTDALEAYVQAIDTPQDISGVFNIVSENTTVGDVAHEVKRFVEATYGKEVPLDIKNIADVRDYKASGEKAKKILGFEPRHSTKTILAELAEHFGPEFDYTHDSYYNIKVFKQLLEKGPSADVQG